MPANACTRRCFLQRLGLGAAALAAARPLHAAREKKPNVVFFMADDMGWMDTPVYGSQYYETPNLVRLAEQGMVFTDAYAANPLCSPTRASILTGKYPARLKITTPTCHLPPRPPDAPLFRKSGPPARKVLTPISRRFLPPKEYTIAEALGDAGYATAHIGKWHLGRNPEHWAREQGFGLTRHGAPDPGPPSYHSPYGFQSGTLPAGPKGEYITDRLTDEAVAFIEANRDRPFLLHLWHYAVHGPWGHKEEITKRFAKKKDPRGKQGNPIMASMLKSMDASLGRVMAALDRLGLAENTLLIFFSDNGGNVHSLTQSDTRTMRVRPGHRRWPMVQSWRKYADHLPPTNNAPLRGGKATIYEGGQRVPCVIRWPGVVEPGIHSAELVSSVDFYPTLLEAVGAEPKPGQVIDGVSLLPALKGKPLDREAVFCHFPHSFGRRSPAATSVRKGHWKLIRVYDTSQHFPEPFELYNLAEDIGETTNLAGEMPEKVRELNALIDEFLEETDAAVPIPNPNYNPRLRPVAGWRPLNHSTLSLQDGTMVIEAPKKRVQMYRRDIQAPAGKCQVKMRMRTATGRHGIAYWATVKEPGFARERRSDFQTQADGAWQEVAAPFEAASPVLGLRLDFSIRPGRVEVDWVRLCRPDGTVVARWEFD
jgi:arylsulfatase A-like enzyme